MGCSSRFTSYERVEDPTLMVIKKDERRERFDRQKILGGIMKACEKRPIGIAQIEKVVAAIEREIKNSQEREISSITIGTRIMEHLKALDHVAYVRFASVYKEFEDISGFQRILEGLVEKHGPETRIDDDTLEILEAQGA
jgi:transcriptional repressor NrdR